MLCPTTATVSHKYGHFLSVTVVQITLFGPYLDLRALPEAPCSRRPLPESESSGKTLSSPVIACGSLLKLLKFTVAFYNFESL